MWEFNKVTLFILMTSMSILGGISLIMVDWEVFENGEGIFREIRLPIIFIGLSILFMIPYVKKIKESKK